MKQLTNAQIRAISLPKWPAMVVRGKDVTQDQAQEILIRTSNFCFCTNDRNFEAALYLAAGIALSTHSYFLSDFDSSEKARKEYGVLSLEYLKNSQICSSYIGGPHGWCNWSGEIRNVPYNIGKWPDTMTVLNEWKAIAEAFPYLDLKCWLFDREYSEELPAPVIHYVVKAGKVKAYKPERHVEVFAAPADMRVFLPGGERGCTFLMFKKALKVTEKALAER